MAQRVEWKGDQVAKAVRKATARGLLHAAEHVLQEARTEVPLDEATLERSGVASVDERSLTAAVSFDTPYAVRQHEDMQARHPGGRKAKYLEDPWRRSGKVTMALIAKQVRKVTDG